MILNVYLHLSKLKNIQMKYNVFISYSRKDTKTVNKICNAFDKNGITYFIDRIGISCIKNN